LLNLNKGQQNLRTQLPKNLITNVVLFLVSILIGVFLVPYYIDTLGVSSYALVPLATSITSYVNLVIQSLNSSVSRYLTVDLQRGDFNKANIIFNTSLFGMLGISLLSLPIIIVVSYYAPTFFEVSTNQRYDAYLLFLGTILSFLISTLGGVFGVSLFAYNRLDLQNILSISDIVIKVAVIILLFSNYSPMLCHIGFANLIASIIIFIATIYISKKVNPHFKVNLSNFKISEMKEIANTGNWLIINQVGTILFLQMDLIVVNKLFGPVAGGEYAALLTWSRLLRTLAGVLSGVLTPIILTYYAKNQFDNMISISKSAVKFMGFAMALPIGCLCGFAPNILSLWIGPEFAKLSPLMWILLSHLIINLSVLPLFSINISLNKVRIPGLVTLFMGVGNFLLALMIPYFTGLGYYGVAIAGAIMLTMKNSFFLPWYTSRLLKIHKYTFITPILCGFIATLVIVIIIYILNYFIDIYTPIHLIFYCGLLSIIYILVVWLIGLSQIERQIINSFIPVTIKSKFKHELDGNQILNKIFSKF